MKNKNWFWFIKGVVVTLVTLAIIVPQYSDYTDKARASEWIMTFKHSDLKAQIESQLKNNSSIKPLSFSYEDYVLHVKPTGLVIIQGNDVGQVMLLEPTMNDKQVSWKCIGGSYKHVPSSCKDQIKL